MSKLFEIYCHECNHWNDVTYYEASRTDPGYADETHCKCGAELDWENADPVDEAERRFDMQEDDLLDAPRYEDELPGRFY